MLLLQAWLLLLLGRLLRLLLRQRCMLPHLLSRMLLLLKVCRRNCA
jgi:hypothetical protein